MNYSKLTIGRRNHGAQTTAGGKVKLAVWAVVAGLTLSASTALGANGEAKDANSPAGQAAAGANPSAPSAPAPLQPVPVPSTTVVAQPAMGPGVGAHGEPLITNGAGANGDITLMVNKTVIITTRVPYKRVSVAQPDVADVNLVGPSEIVLTAKKPGSTQLILWDDQDHSQVVDVIVNFDLQGLQTQMKSMFPKSAIKIDSANGAIVLRGHVPDLETATQAVAVATPYSVSGPNSAVLNFLEVSGGQQVVLQVRFAEVSRSVSEGLGFNAFATDGKFKFGINEGPGDTPIGSLSSGAAPTIDSSVPVFGAAQAGNASFEMFLTALRQNNLLRDLAEPNLTAISGNTASFLAGGEFPIPVPQAGGGGSAITIEYKKYGISLNFTPTVLGDGRLRLHCTPAVSSLDYTNSVTLNGFVVPALTTRNVDTTVELAEGQTFALAGLLDNKIVADKSVTPLLGDLPVLGALFRSVKYQRTETELIVLVTPRMVEGLNPTQVPRLPGNPWRDPTEVQLFFNTDLGGPAPDYRHAPATHPEHFYGPAGYNPPSEVPATQR